MKIGDWMLVYFPADESGKQRKLSHPWHGPYRMCPRMIQTSSQQRYTSLMTRISRFIEIECRYVLLISQLDISGMGTTSDSPDHPS